MSAEVAAAGSGSERSALEAEGPEDDGAPMTPRDWCLVTADGGRRAAGISEEHLNQMAELRPGRIGDLPRRPQRQGPLSETEDEEAEDAPPGGSGDSPDPLKQAVLELTKITKTLVPKKRSRSPTWRASSLGVWRTRETDLPEVAPAETRRLWPP